MVEEKTPQYIIDLKKDLTRDLKKIIEKEIGGLAASTAREFTLVYEKLDKTNERLNGIDFGIDTINNQLYTMNDKIGKIEGHIGRYEIRAQNIEKILEEDLKVSIHELEKVVFGV
jgi:archaellum component FlaC